MAVSGSNVSLQISEELLGNYTQLTWFYNTRQKIVEWEVLVPPVYYNSLLKNRIRLDPQSPAHLHIYHLQKEDSSTYILRVSKESGKEKEWKIPLQVFGELWEPGQVPTSGPPHKPLVGFLRVLVTGKAEFISSQSQFYLRVSLDQQALKFVAIGHLKPHLNLAW